MSNYFTKQEKISRSLRELEEQMSFLTGKELDTSLIKYGELQLKFEHEGGYEIVEKLSKVCTGLSITEEFKKQLFSTLSGGEKTIVILAKILLQAPDILLLDEPSNHLDMEAMEWLEDFLKDYKGMALMVSHDRYFLDRVVTKIVEIEDMESETYVGNYSDFVKEKEKRMMLQFDAFEDQQKKIKAIENTIKQLRDWGSQRSDNPKFIKRAVSMEKRLEKMQRVEKPIFEKQNMRIKFLTSERSGNEVVKLKEVTKGFQDKLLLNKADLLIRHGERVVIIGNNGTGKSTLIKLLLKEYTVDSGTAELGSAVKLGYLPQNVTFANEELTVLECFRENKTISEGKAREFLARFMFYGENVFKKVRNLSGGEKSRLKLCFLLYEDVNVLILDEPTNHLDIDSRETLEEALGNFEGTILFVSHDRYFINIICTRIVDLREKKLISYDGNYEYYKEKRVAERIVDSKVEIVRTVVKVQEIKPKSGDNNSKKKQWEIEKLEDDIVGIEKSIEELDKLMIENASNYEKLNELLAEKINKQQDLEEVVGRWACLY